MADSPTYVFADDGKVYAYAHGRVVAAADEVEDLEAREDELSQEPKKQAEPPKTHDEKKDEQPKRSTHIITPNGLKGQILGKVKGMWGEQVTVRLESGRIAKYDVTTDSNIEYISEERTASSPYARLEERLAASPDGTRASLVQRLTELKAIKNDAQAMFSQASYVDEATLNNIIVTAEAEVHEVTDAIEHLDNAVAYEPPTPQVFEQESVGGNDSSWLDSVGQEVEVDNELINDPEAVEDSAEEFVATLPEAMLGDQDGIELRAASHLARLTPENQQVFIHRVVAAVKRELSEREPGDIHKEASDDNFDGPAEGLFF
jgi:hypothetical protein